MFLAVMRTRARIAVALAVPLVCLALTGCGVGPRIGVNTPPTLTLTSGPVDTLSSPQSWLVDIAWTASDPDGIIDHFEYAIDPPTRKMTFALSAETSWVSTRETHVRARFRASVPDSVGPGATASDFHVFVLRAIDNRGGISPRVIRAFYAYTVAPDVKITRPAPNPFFPWVVPVPFRVQWQGHDADGEGDGRPSAYRVRILDLGDPTNMAFLADPDSLRRLAVTNGWEGWRTIPGDTTSVIVTTDDIGAGAENLFALVAVDAAGASTPYMSMEENLLMFRRSLSAASNAPRLHIRSPYIDFTYESGGYSLDPLREIPVEIAAGIEVEFGWDAIAAPGRVPVSSRWRVDGDVTDDAGWSALGPPAQQVRIPPQSAGVHRLYIEVRDDFGDVSLGIVKMTFVTAELTNELLVVDDTRREVDKFPGGQLAPYVTPWPSASELDTLLFARGGYPWRGARNPAGALSVPGLFAGYALDTLGTRLGLVNPAQAVTLSRLAVYRHVLWLVDERGGSFLEGGDQTFFPMTALAAMSGPGRFNTLGAYVEAGGKLWFAGGATAFASLKAYDKGWNNLGSVTIFSAAPEFDELGPGRTLYDAAHLRSEVAVTKTTAHPERSAAARGGWSGHGPDGALSAPDYKKLPPTLELRSAANDPIPPTRLASQASLYYPINAAFEVVHAPNEIREPIDPVGDPPVESVLDTLYDVTSPAFGDSPMPAMLYYHGRENPPFIFTGFDLWSWRRENCQALVDFVLSDIWGLAKAGPRATIARLSAGSADHAVARSRSSPPATPAPPLARVPIRR